MAISVSSVSSSEETEEAEETPTFGRDSSLKGFLEKAEGTNCKTCDCPLDYWMDASATFLGSYSIYEIVIRVFPTIHLKP
jgi:hypothetical protein